MNPSWNRFQEAQRRLNLVKRHAHEIVGVKREQVHMVVENFSKPGTYDITVHENGKVTTQNWTPPAQEFEVPATFPVSDPEKVIDEVAQELSPVILQQPTVQQAVTEVLPPTPTSENLVEAVEDRLAEVVKDNAPAPESPAAPRSHRGRGRPKKTV